MGTLKTVVYYFPSVFFLTYVFSLENPSIINLIKLDKTSNCYSENTGEDFLHSLDLNEIPEFGAMCNIPPPNNRQLKFLLENNVTPILCMGILDVFQRFCKLAKQDHQFMNNFPLTVEETAKLFHSFEMSQHFSSLPTFCSSTVRNVTFTESENIWWNELSQQFRNENECSSLCRIVDKSKVNPLCSFIIWFNSLNQSRIEMVLYDSMPSSKGNVNGERGQPEEVKESALDSNQIWSSSVQIQSTPISLSTELSTGTTVHVKGQSTVPQANIPISKAEISEEPQAKLPSIASPQAKLSKVNTLSFDSAKSESKNNTSAWQTEAISNHKLKIQTKTANETKEKETKTISNIKVNPSSSKSHIENVNEKYNNSKTGMNQSSSLQSGIEIIVKDVDGNGKSGISKPVIHDTKKTAKPAESMVETDFSLEMTPDGMEIEQPTLADKNLQQQFSDEELENGDGDDIDFEPEGSAKTGQNKTTLNKSKSSPASVDQGINDSDKVYGEEREILIEDHFIEAEDSHFFTYFLCMAVLTIMAYLAFHNKKKLVALALEGKRSRSSRRRPNSSNYSKLDCSLEEAMTSSHTPASATHVLY